MEEPTNTWQAEIIAQTAKVKRLNDLLRNKPTLADRRDNAIDELEMLVDASTNLIRLLKRSETPIEYMAVMRWMASDDMPHCRHSEALHALFNDAQTAVSHETNYRADLVLEALKEVK